MTRALDGTMPGRAARRESQSRIGGPDLRIQLTHHASRYTASTVLTLAPIVESPSTDSGWLAECGLDARPPPVPTSEWDNGRIRSRAFPASSLAESGRRVATIWPQLGLAGDWSLESCEGG